MFSDFAIARAARVVALLAEARHEAGSLRVMQDSLQSLNSQLRAVNEALDLRFAAATLCLGAGTPLPAEHQSSSSITQFAAFCLIQASLQNALPKSIDFASL